MKNRLLRCAGSIAIVLVAYSAYALVVVPWVEPEQRARHSTALTDEERNAALRANQRYQPLFESFFPPGHWALDNPKVLESDEAMLLINEYQPLKDGRVRLNPCIMLFFPKPPTDDATRREAVLLEAPQGAVLHFDGGFDLGKGNVGKLNYGKLFGQITIRSDMREPGEADDMYIVTREVEMNEGRIWTKENVQFRIGPNHGRGSNMEIRLLPGQNRPGRNPAALNIGGIQSFALMRNVQMHLQLGGAKLLPSSDDTQTIEQPVAEPKKPQPPVDITCQGPFHFDLINHVATFEDQVDVVRANPAGPSDQMICQLLSVYFQPKPTPDGKPREAKSPGAIQPLEPTVLEARGNPVIVRSPSTAGGARCQRLEYDLKQRKITLDGDTPITLFQKGSEVHAPALQYQVSQQPGQLGTVWASGPGNLRSSSAENPDQVFKASWQQELNVRRHQGVPVISLRGRPVLEMEGQGRLVSDQVHLWLREVPPAAGEARTTETEKSRPKLEADRMLADGDVTIDSPQLVGATERLEIWFKQLQAKPEAAVAMAPRKPSKERPSSGPPAATSNLPKKPTTSAEDENDPLAQLARRDEGEPQQQYDVRGKLIRLQVTSSEERTSVSDVAVDGNVVFRETQTKKPGEEPLVVRGDQLQVSHADTPNTRVIVSGRPAHVEARGMTTEGPSIHLDRGQNRIWIDKPGMMKVPMRRDPQDAAQPGEQSLLVNWDGSMNFDGRTMRFQRNVLVRGERQYLKADMLDVQLNQRIDFGQRQKRQAKIEVREVFAQGGVYLENRGADETGVATSVDRLQAETLKLNQLSGDIYGAGPGWLTSVRRGGAPELNQTTVAPRGERTPETKDDELSFLRVDFSRNLEGNLNRHQIRFQGNVRTVYGPVAHWEDTIDADAPTGLGERGVLLNCDSLTVTEVNWTEKKRGTIEMEALGNALVEGDVFTARAHRMSYAQAKDLIVLEGSGRSDAQLWRQPQVGGATSRAAARKILYWRSANRVEVDDARFLDLNQIGRGAASPRR